ncbi:MAG TPA: hypothetical protein VE549_10170, partial [Myxococcaceae bacterium]|nr:hypothetical protein [Myxococcaceae bacterium]
DLRNEEPRCGNGKRETAGAVPEECDGADLGAVSCEGLGFQGGELHCSNDCKLPADTCLASSPPSRVEPRALEGDAAGLALARDGALVAVSSVHRGLELLRFDRKTLKPIGSKTTWTMPDGSGSAVSTPFVASLDGGSSLISVTRDGRTPETLIFRVDGDGRIVETGVTVPGRALFLTAKGDRALLGTLSQRTGNTLEAVVVDGQGKLLGTLKTMLTVSATSGYVRGAAVATPSGWFASLGTNGTFFTTTPFARIATDGRLIGSGALPVNGGQMAVARGPSSSFLVQTHPGGVLVTEISDAGVATRSRKLSSEPMSWMVAATVEGRRLIAWASDYAKLRRFELELDGHEPTAATVIQVPMYIPIASLVVNGKLHHLFQMSPMPSRPMDRAFWMFSGR